jgi:hypothetical protein
LNYQINICRVAEDGLRHADLIIATVEHVCIGVNNNKQGKWQIELEWDQQLLGYKDYKSWADAIH